MTPSRSGRTAMMFAGVRPTIRFASAPMARTRFVFASIATTDGSLITIPRSRTGTRGPVEGDAPIAERHVRVVADDEVVEQGDIEQSSCRQGLGREVQVVG